MNRWHRMPLWRPRGTKIKFSAQPLEGKVCWMCGSIDHAKTNCPALGKENCGHCRSNTHLVQMCFKKHPELDFLNWEDGVAYPGAAIVGTPEEEAWSKALAFALWPGAQGLAYAAWASATASQRVWAFVSDRRRLCGLECFAAHWIGGWRAACKRRPRRGR